MAKTKEKVVERARSDEDLRENVMTAFAAAKEVYDELVGKRGVTTVSRAVAADEEMQATLKRALDELRTAASRIEERAGTIGGASLAPEEREALAERAAEISVLAASPGFSLVESDAEAGAAAERSAWHRDLQDKVLDLCNALPAGAEDYEARQLLLSVAELGRAIEDDSEARDAAGRIELARLRVVDVAERLRRRLQHRLLDLPEEAARRIFATLPDVSAAELSELLGVSTKTVGAWRRGKPVKTNAVRVVDIARVLGYLGSSMTPRGLMLWFHAEQDRLDNRTPLEVLDRGDANELVALTALARGSRGQLGD
jgi:transcriptional regulator with XRE-family HTH domain